MSGSRLAVVNRLLLKLVRTVRLLAYRHEIRQAGRQRPELFKPLDPSLEQAHQAYWAGLGKVDCHWLRLYINLSGIEDHRYIPNDLYIAVVERRLNDGNYNSLVGDKNCLERLFGRDHFPVAVLRCISGVFLDPEYCITRSPLALLPPRELIVKPSVESKGGADVALLRYESEVHLTAGGTEVTPGLLQQTWGDNFIVQEVLRQHDFCAAFNSGSVNTFRVYTYRSVADETVHVLKVVFRNGSGDSVVDNMASSGGVSTIVDTQGRLGHYAVSKAGDKVVAHPVTGEPYDGRVVPHFESITALPLAMAATIPSHRLLGFDVALTGDGAPIIVEINPMGISLNMMQYDGGPLFGEFSDEVLEYCTRHPGRDNMRILRT
jgi:hypothetical protein